MFAAETFCLTSFANSVRTISISSSRSLMKILIDCKPRINLCRTPLYQVFCFDNQQLASMAFQPVLQSPNEKFLLMRFLYLYYEIVK